MTREEILSLSGPALSEAVAEHVMGLNRAFWCGANISAKGSVWAPDISSGEKPSFYFFIPHGDLFYFINDFNALTRWEPHKDIAAAFSVIDRLAILGKQFCAVRGFGHLKNGEWSVSVNPFGRQSITHVCENLSLPVAICRAALLSVITP